jgi:hypothetical protein
VSPVCVSTTSSVPTRATVTTTGARSASVGAHAVPDARTSERPARPSIRSDPAPARTLRLVASPIDNSAPRDGVSSHDQPPTDTTHPDEPATRTGTRDRRILYHAAAIHHALGNDQEARDLIETALDGHPTFDLVNAPAARALGHALGVDS